VTVTEIETTVRKFLVVTRELGRERVAIYYDEPPTKGMLNGCELVHLQELVGAWHGMTLAELRDDYLARRNAGTLKGKRMLQRREGKQGEA
jgi:hypothetical protein